VIPSKYVVFRAQACDSRHVISEIKFCYSFITPVIVYAWLQPVFTALHGMQTRPSDENSVCLSVCICNCWYWIGCLAYLSEDVIPRTESLTAWWAAKAARFPVLSVEAKRFLSAPPTSLASERLFSSAAHTLTDVRGFCRNERTCCFSLSSVLIVKFNYGSVSNKWTLH